MVQMETQLQSIFEEVVVSGRARVQAGGGRGGDAGRRGQAGTRGGGARDLPGPPLPAAPLLRLRVYVQRLAILELLSHSKSSWNSEHPW